MVHGRTHPTVGRRVTVDASGEGSRGGVFDSGTLFDPGAVVDSGPGCDPIPVAHELVTDELVVEEPLEIHLGGELVSTTMRTPGHDFELAVGFLWAEGILDGTPRDIDYGPSSSTAAAEFNAVTVLPGSADAPRGVPLNRLGLTSSSCGICGARQIESLTDRLEPFPRRPGAQVGAGSGSGSASDAARLRVVLEAAQAELRCSQDLFARTGGSHAAAAVGPAGSVAAFREDIGRHNAVDKVVGAMLLGETLPALHRRAEQLESPPLADDPAASETANWALWVSGRASFEIIQKAWAGGFSTVVAVGAVSALALHTATTANMTLVGFGREDRATVYTGQERGELP